MSYLVLSPQERTANVVETPDEAARACGSFISHPVVIAWCARAAMGDVLQDDGIGRGRVQVVALGEVTDIAALRLKADAAEEIREATTTVERAVAALKGQRS